jgi:hypothetical protein
MLVLTEMKYELKEKDAEQNILSTSFRDSDFIVILLLQVFPGTLRMHY